jgi:hypothetical protein
MRFISRATNIWIFVTLVPLTAYGYTHWSEA